MKKNVTNWIFCLAVVAVGVLAVRFGRREAPVSAPVSGVPAASAGGMASPVRPSRFGRAGIARPARAARAAAVRRVSPVVEPEMDEAAFSAWLDPRPPRTGDEMEDIPADEEEYPIRLLDAQARFRRAVFETLADPSLNHAAFGRSLLSSGTASLRSLGAALLVETGAFSAADAAALAADADASVPLAAAEWIRERGTPEQLAALDSALAARGTSVEELLAVLVSGSSAAGGAREALDRLLKTAPEEDLPDLLAAVATAEAAAYDARMQALMALRGVAPFSVADGVMVKMELAAEPPTESLWGESLDLYSDLVDLAARDKAPYKVWDVLVRDLDFLAGLDYENNVRDMANYVENGVRGDDPVVQEGAWRRIDAYVADVRASGHADDDAVAEPLARLVRLNEKLKPFDPEFAVPDPEPPPAAEEPDEPDEADEPAGTTASDEPDEATGPEKPDDETGLFDASGNPQGSGSETVPIGVETIEPYHP